jgi:hypothetical protein
VVDNGAQMIIMSIDYQARRSLWAICGANLSGATMDNA